MSALLSRQYSRTYSLLECSFWHVVDPTHAPQGRTGPFALLRTLASLNEGRALQFHACTRCCDGPQWPSFLLFVQDCSMTRHLKLSSDEVAPLRGYYQGIAYDVLRTLWRHRRLVTWFGAGGFAIAIVAMVVISPRYTSEALAAGEFQPRRAEHHDQNTKNSFYGSGSRGRERAPRS